MTVATESVINERAQRLLKALVERYIREGQPVGSRTLARDAGLDLSPATVRNVMSDLEELGLLRAPHTSAGRIPTAQGYRLFVDTLLTIEPLPRVDVSRLRLQLNPAADPDDLLASASGLLSDVTRLAGVVMVPKRESLTLRHVEFLPLSANRVLVILVVNEHDVQNRIIQTPRAYSAAELQQVSNYLNREFAGRDLHRVREELLRGMRETRESVNRIMVTAIEMADQVFTPAPESDDFVVSGQTNLMSYAEMSDIDKLRQLFEAFNTKRDLLQLLDHALDAERVQIFIGEESGYDVLDACSLVTAPYEVDGDVVGVLGVIGPTRMAYDRVIPIVDITAKLLGSALKPGA